MHLYLGNYLEQLYIYIYIYILLFTLICTIYGHCMYVSVCNNKLILSNNVKILVLVIQISLSTDYYRWSHYKTL